MTTLTRQVAALDSTEKGHTGLASYYTERGETPGVWIGSGLDGIDGLTAGDPVSAEQMRALFGCGLHPLAELRQQQLQGPDLSRRDFHEVTRLGVPFKIVDGVVSPFRLEVAKRIAAINTAAGLPADAPMPAADRARVRTEVAHEFFLAQHGREPVDARELAGQIAKDSRPRTQTVAGYDLTFSPVKSVSTLWAVADPAVAAVVERAHQAAVKDALRFIEDRALFTRTGPQGIRQVNVRGLVATAFTHRDSRAGDPDLHTHVAVANKVQTVDGRWLSIDGRVLFKANVAASETYNTAMEQHLRETLGVRFTERPGTDPAKRPIREIVGVDPRLNQRWSTRRAHIQARRGELAIRFQDDHGRPPTPVEALHLAQQATLETRDAKHEPRSIAEQRSTWLSEAAAVLGGRGAVAAMVRTVLAPSAETTTIADARWVSQTAGRVTAAMEQSRSTWQMWHVRAEAQRQLRTIDVPAEHAVTLVDLLVDEVLDRRSVALAAPHDGIEEPEVLRRVDGSSVYTIAGAALYTSQRILDAELRLVAAAGRRDGTVVERASVDLALLEMAVNGTALDAGQASLVRQMCTSGARLQLAIAPAGAGKTTAMRALALAWTEDGGDVVGLAPSAAAAAVLGEQTGIRADTLAKLTWSLQHGDLPEWAARIGPSTLVIIDEAGMADTLSLDTAAQFVIGRGGSVRLVGDDQQLAAIGAGGVLRDIKTQHGAPKLTELHRFTNPAEAAATLALRDGDPQALDFYLKQGRVHVGDVATTTEDAFSAWVSDRAAGLDAIMIAPSRESGRRTQPPRQGASPQPHPGRTGSASNRREFGQCRRCDHHPQQRPPTPTHSHRMGQERRPLDGHPCRQTRRPDRPAHPQLPPGPTSRRLCPRVDRSRLRQHHPRRPRRLRRHHARPRNGAGVTTAALHHAQSRTGRQPPLPPSRRRRRPAHHHPARNRRTPHADRDLATNPRPRRHPHLSHHPAARTQRTGCSAVRGRSALHRRPPRRSRAAGWPPDR